MKAIIFDCFGVLTADLWREFIGTLPEDQRHAASDCNKAFDAGFISVDEFMDQIRSLTGRVPPLTETSPMPVKNTQLLDYIAALKPNYKLALLSNISSNWISDSFLTSDEQALFDEMIFSHTVRLTKPDPAIYVLTAEKLGVDPADCVMIDDIERNCRGAEAVGMKAVLYENYLQLTSDLEVILSQSEK